MKLILKVVVIALIVFALFIVQRFYSYGIQSRAGEPAGLVDGSLSSCPATPNCVNSEFPSDQAHYIAPIEYPTMLPEQLMPLLAATVHSMGGTVNEQGKEYLAATFTSRLFHFVDDFELRIDAKNSVIHLRSASRVGHGDLGVNHQRATEFRKKLGAALTN